MPHILVRRLCAGLAVATAAVATTALPAAAAPRAAGISMSLRDVTAPAGADGAQLTPSFHADQDVVVQEPTITYDLDGPAGVTLVPMDGIGACENVSPTKLTCSDPFEIGIGPDGISGWFEIAVKADESAEIGSSGRLVATFAGKDTAPVTAWSNVRVAEAVDLTAGRPIKVSAAPGDDLNPPLVVRNTGGKTIHGAAVQFAEDYAFEAVGRYRNCLYLDDEITSCTFDETLEVDASYAVTAPFKVRADTRAPSSQAAEFEWMTLADLEDWHQYLASRGFELGSPGDGGVLTLAELSPRKAKGAPQSDAYPDDNWSHIDLTVTGTNGVDLAAVGSEVTGKVGDEVIATAGVRNVGPAALDLGRLGAPAAVTAVYAPEGTSLRSVPEFCYEVSATKFECFTSALFRPGDAETYKFKLRIDKVVANAKGDVVVNEPCECEHFDKDVNLANNKAAILVNKTGGTGGGDDDPSLPVTGPAGVTAAIGGLALLVLGTAGFVLARRRRTTFTS